MAKVWSYRAFLAIRLLAILGFCVGVGYAQSARISVGPNVQISASDAKRNHVEVIADADPRDPQRIMACSMVETRPVERIQVAVYVSADGGKTWSKKLETERGAWDPDCHFDGEGNAYFAADIDLKKEGATAKSGPSSVVVYRSSDDGITWGTPHTVLDVTDREWLGVDRSGRHSPLYLYFCNFLKSYGSETPSPSDFMQNMKIGIQFVKSEDRGETFLGHAGMIMPSGDRDLLPSRPVFLSDGTLVILLPRVMGTFADQRNGSVPQRHQGAPTGALTVVTVADGSATFGEPVKVADWYAAEWGTNRVCPTIAVDPGSRWFKDRLYVAFADVRSGRSEIMTAYSADKGKTWSSPKVIGDSLPASDSKAGPDDFQATIGVNRDGVVGVMWYDRRGIADNVGYNARFSASLDGGETWLPSVRLSESPNVFDGKEFPDIWLDIRQAAEKSENPDEIEFSDGTWQIGGHTAGIAAAADGSFYPVWVDNRTRYQQLWTSRVTVSGAAIKNGSEELSTMADVSHDVTFELSELSFDRETNTLSATAQLKNTSKETINGPIKARLVTLHSEIGGGTVASSDNGQIGPGAVWDFTPLLENGSLAAGQQSKPKKLAFHFSNVRSIHRNDEFRMQMLTVDARVLAGAKR
jgi:hypothetical protein